MKKMKKAAPRRTAAKSSSKVASKSAVKTVKPMAMPTKMKMTTKKEAMNFTQLLVMFISFLVMNAVILALAGWAFPTEVVLGTHRLTALSAVLVSSTLLAFIATAVTPIVEMLSGDKKMSDVNWMGLYLLVNVASLWVVAHMAEMIGVGISSWAVVILVAAVMDLAQGLSFKALIGKV